ncbi:MAG: Phosphoserine phosphatase 1 [Chloroflexi bacterium]|nr:Phosphoserine phosphatase 1 [Chloroflexota bacterium]MBT9166056.1 Phosphoserine phosphatase 1 [Chloroflexota bacterium]
MARLILVRHGETEWNRSLRYQGHSDIHLNDNGTEQAAMVSDRLASERIDVIYSSDLSRSHETARSIASMHGMVEIRQSPLLREMNFGQAEGMTFDEIKERYPRIAGDLQAWRTRSPETRIPDGESIAELGARVAQFTEELKGHEPEETVLVVAHGGSLQVLICLLLGIGLEHWWQVRLSNASITIMETSPYGAAFIVLNDTCHLQ